MSLQGTLNLGHGVAETLCFGQKQFLTPIQIDITIKMNWRRLWQTKKFTEQEMLTLRNSKYRVSTFMIQHQFFHALLGGFHARPDSVGLVADRGKGSVQLGKGGNAALGVAAVVDTLRASGAFKVGI